MHFNKYNLVFLITLMFMATAWSQTTGKIAGTVFDKASGEPLAGANVLLEGTSLGASVDGNGAYFIINVAPGTYTLSFEMLGYKTVKVEKVKVSVNRTAYVSVKLSPAVLTSDEVVVVTADKFANKKDQTSSMRAVSSDQIDKLPVETISAVVQMQAGVVNGHFRGGRSNEVSYMIDGLPVSEPFGGNGSTVDLETESVSDLEVITGTFNAEYGRAMSGVVNAVTKDGGPVFKVSASLASGFYPTGHSDVFIGLGKIDPFRNRDYRFDIEGPLWDKNLTFFATLRIQDNKNHLNGLRRFRVSDYSDYSSDDPSMWYTEHTGDNSYVPMNRSHNLSAMVKLTYKFDNGAKISMMYNRNDDEWHNYIHAFKYNPDGVPASFRISDMLSLRFNQMLTKNAFYQVNLSALNNFNGYYLYENALDSTKYVHDGYLRGTENVGFFTGGQLKNHNKRYLQDYNAKFDFTWQVNKQHGLKTGFLLTQHNLDNTEQQIRNLYFNTDKENVLLPVDGKLKYIYYQPVVYGNESIYSDIYKVNPFEFSAYIQDKIELEDMVLNIGLRGDYFNPNTVYPSDLRNPGNQIFQGDTSRSSVYKKAPASFQLSPRIGLAYQLGDKAVLRFSYGHFFQMPPLYALYQNNSFLVAPTDYVTTMGNARLKPQKTVSYEFGLEQQLFAGFNLGVALYYRDIYDLLSTKVVTTYNQIEYGLYTNKDYGNSRGLELKADFTTGSFNANLNYTLQFTRGNADNPLQTFSRAGASQDPVKRLIVMSWDQRHTLNLSVGWHQNNWGFSSTAYYNSGSPYSWRPISLSRLADINFAPNNDYRPTRLSVDISANYTLSLGDKQSLKFYLLGFNILDRLNEVFVNPTTGRAYTAIVLPSDIDSHRQDFNDYFDRIRDPGQYAAPRYLKLGVTFNY
ncbi:MAG: TonB-dependent receptor [Calditrichaeota bacterium]|nr:MAG: TonB-dependent receptor [Calditrichota bacterium]